MANTTNVKMTVDLQDIELQAFESLHTNLDLQDFKETVKKAQDIIIKENALQMDSEIIVAANNFLLSVKEAQDTIRQAELLANKLKAVRYLYQNMLPKKRGNIQNWKNSFADNITFSNEDLYNNYNEARDYMTNLFNDQKIKELYKKADIFNNKIVKAMQGRELKTIISIVGDDGNPILYEVDMGKFIEERMKFGYSSGQIASLSGNFNISSQAIAEKLKSLKKINSNLDNNQLNLLNKTFQDVLNRYKISKKNRYIMWKTSEGWNKAKVGSQGDIAEAYSLFYFSNKYNFGIDSELNVEQFVMKGIVEVDAVSGLYQGDISLENQIYDYAIKKGNASFMELSQIVKLTEKILLAAQNNNNIIQLIKEEYKKELDKNEGVIRTRVSKVGAQSVSKNMKQYIKSLEGNY